MSLNTINTNARGSLRALAAALCVAVSLGAHAQGGSGASAASATQPDTSSSAPHATPAVAASSGADRALAVNVRHALKAARKQGLKSSFIRVRARDGVVTLSGVVASESQIALATSVAQGVSGVRSVTTKLIIRDDEGIKGSQ
ncbi:MAG TPA: BON domain-containing protein [Paraburkholderia sp.]|jgi:hyperosmotically inducible protein|uniref:BON domain-containing protein n=1 Tax=Paraburkholderia sp. TaxID=1926495 RepID=UPI002DE54570|nr:BON domain-containing protein [Paraburkholderia sp.]